MILTSDPKGSYKRRKKKFLRTKKFPKRFRSRGGMAEKKKYTFKSNLKGKISLNVEDLRQWEEEEIKLTAMMEKYRKIKEKLCLRKRKSTNQEE